MNKGIGKNETWSVPGDPVYLGLTQLKVKVLCPGNPSVTSKLEQLVTQTALNSPIPFPRDDHC